MEIIESIKSKGKRAKKEIQEKLLKLAECIDDDDCLDIDGPEDLVCIIDHATTKAKSKMRK